MPTVLKSGSLNLLEPSGLVQACNGIAAPFYCYLITNVTIAAFHTDLGLVSPFLSSSPRALVLVHWPAAGDLDVQVNKQRIIWNRESAVTIMTTLTAGKPRNLRSIPTEAIIFSSAKCPNGLWVPSILLLNGYQGLPPRGPGFEDDHSFPSSAKIKTRCS